VAEKQVEFLPFHALNEFMRPDFQQTVVRAALAAMPTLPNSLRAPIDRLTKQLVRVPGFRNAAQAPPAIRTAPTVAAFEKSPELTAAILAAWAESRPLLRAQVWDLLHSRGWELLPPDADRTKLPGFLTRWPSGEDFEALNSAYTTAHPDETQTTDDVSLMVVWVSGRLPVDVDEADEAGEGEPEEDEAEAGSDEENT
jgi:hypothetical protein